MIRPPLHECMLDVAKILARRATCAKLAVGCVLVDESGRVLGTGYNGVPYDFVHCTEVLCKGATMPAGSDTCEAVHAEQNALFGVDPYRVYTCYTTHAPCLRCTKMLLNTSCELLVYEATPFEGASLWNRAGRRTLIFDRHLHSV